MEPIIPQSKVQNRKLEDAIAGNYDFSVTTIIDEAWARTSGFKSTYWGAVLLFLIPTIAIMAAVICLTLIVGMLTNVSIKELMETGQWQKVEYAPMLLTFLGLILLALPFILSMNAGVWMVGIHRVADKPTKATMVYQYFNNKMSLFWGYLFLQLLSFVADFFTSYLPDIIQRGHSNIAYFIKGFSMLLGWIIYVYIAVSYMFFRPLVVEKNLSAWVALETCRRACAHRWFRIAALIGLVFLVLFVPLLAIMLLQMYVHSAFVILTVIFVWLMPFALLALCILYREIFGITPISE